MKKYWKTRLSKESEKYEVRINRLRLELGLFGARVRGNEAMAIEIAVKSDSSSNSALRFSLPFYPKSKRRCVFTTDRKPIRKSPTLSWEARDLRDFHVLLKGDNAVCDMAFHVLYDEGSGGKGGGKIAVVGKVSMDLTVAELLDRKQTKTKSNCQIRRRLPIELRINGLAIEATLSVSGSFLKLNSSSQHDSRSKTPENSVSSKSKQNERKIDELSPSDSEDYRWFDSDDSSKSSISTSTTSSGSSLSFHVPPTSNPKNKSDTDNSLDRIQRNSSNLKGPNFRATNTRRPDTLTKKPYEGWQKKELMSRDGQAKLETSVFFASFDQRSERASGESACAALVTVVAHWLHSNKDMPRRSEFDSLITEGSSEWRRLCERDDALLEPEIVVKTESNKNNLEQIYLIRKSKNLTLSHK